MSSFVFASGIGLILLMVVVMYRLVVGPTVVDRLVAVNILGTKTIVLLVIMGLVFGRVEMFIDISLGYGLLNFIASIAAARYFQNSQTLVAKDDWESEE